MNRKNPDEKVEQKSICFKKRQIRFMEKYPQFNPHKFCQVAVDEQIKQIDETFLEHETTIN